MVARVQAIYFDLDDTLCGYWDASKIGLRRAFELQGPPGYAVPELIELWSTVFQDFAPGLKNSEWYAGYLKNAEPSRTEQMRRTLARLGIDDLERAALLSRTYMEERDRALKLFPDANPVLEELSARFPLGIITNGPADVQRQEIATLGIAHYFQSIFIEGEMGEGKPLRAVFDRAAAAVGCVAGEMLMVGNSYPHDIRSALEAGWQAVWVRRESDAPPGASVAAGPVLPKGAPGPSAIISKLSELLELLSVA